MMIRSSWIIMLCLMTACAPAFAFVDPPVLVPEHPVAGETVSVSIRIGVCDAFVEAPGYPEITQNGSSIHVLLASVHATSSDWCVFYPIATAVIPIGELSSGNYTLQVDRTYEDFFGEDVVEILGVINFSVTGTRPAAIPMLGRYEFVAILVGVLVFAMFFLRNRHARLHLAILLSLIPLELRPQTASDQFAIALLLNEDAGAPSAKTVVDYYAANPRSGKPPLASLAAGNPQSVAYLLPLRASGDFAAFLAAHPNSTRATLERYLVALYPTGADIQAALAALVADPTVVVAYEIPPSAFSSVQLLQYEIDGSDGVSQYGRNALNIDAAWELAGGYAMVGMIDSGLAAEHPALRQFSPGGQYIGGNFVPVASLDLGSWPNTVDTNVDEAEPLPLPPTSVCNPQDLPAVLPAIAGHGTHSSGLLAANVGTTFGVKGTCRKCGIAMWKASNLYCRQTTGQVLPQLNAAAIVASITFLADTGAQTINMSFGGPRDDPDFCANDPSIAYCLALTHARNRDIVLVAASGNHREALQFPASDPRVIAVGGFEAGLRLWDESPGSLTYCPYADGRECGSNYTTVSGDPKQELMASADAASSTTYPGYDWNPQVECGDSFGTPMGDGIGLCTGTSMSAPQISGVTGILRSINPLVLVGRATYNPFFDVMGVRYALASTTFEAQAYQGWSPTFGYGHPDAAAAARKVLGKVAGAVVRNRATPLFRLVTTATNDHAAVTSPQYALALMINQDKNYAPSGTLVPDYAFPVEVGITLPAPRGGAYVLTADVKPHNDWPDLVPLHLVSKDFTSGFDYMLVTTDSDIEQAHDDGYDLRNIQGYIYELCTPEPTCIPPGAESFYRACKTSDNDCAMFVESERSTFEAEGFTSAWPAGSNKRLGYAYPPGDSDSDRLPDGFEYVVGTNANLADSDGDGSSDADEFPMTGIAISDPCAGGSLDASACPADHIFEDGFEAP